MSRGNEAAAAEVFFALSDPTRLRVVSRLGRGQALSATALSDGAAISRQAIVKHLRVLEGAGLLTHAKHGREVLFALDARRLLDAQSFLARISLSWDRALDRLRALVEEPAPPARTPARARRGRKRS